MQFSKLCSLVDQKILFSFIFVAPAKMIVLGVRLKRVVISDLKDLKPMKKRWAILIVLIIVIMMVLISALATKAADTEQMRQAKRSDYQLELTVVPAPPSPHALVNNTEYFWGDHEPALFAYRTVAAYRGWSEIKIVAWEDFMFQIMYRESAFCWNSRAWSHDTYTGMPCNERNSRGEIRHQGRRDDVGFGQITNILRTPTSPLCVEENICSIEQTIATPWSSMTAFVRVIEDGGKGAWCYPGSSHRPRYYCQNRYPDVP